MGGLYRDGGVAVMARAFSDGLAGAGENKVMPGLHDVEANAARAENDHGFAEPDFGAIVLQTSPFTNSMRLTCGMSEPSTKSVLILYRDSNSA